MNIDEIYATMVEVKWKRNDPNPYLTQLSSDPRYYLFKDGRFRIPTKEQLEEALRDMR